MCEYCNLQKYEKSWEIDVLRKTVDIDGYTELVLKYNKNTKEYSIHAEGEGHPTFRMKYCPNCGRDLIANEGGIVMKNNIHDKIFTCPKCGNDTLVPVDGNEDVIGIGYHDVCICEECAAELWSEPQVDYTVKFVEINEEE